MTASAHLAQYGVTVVEARAFIIFNLNNLQEILNTAKQFCVTNDMLAEIYGGVTADDVRSFFTYNGFDSSQLDGNCEILQDGEVSNSLRDTQPYQNIGVIISTFGDGVRVQGTATIVGKNDILTAMHVVYNPDHGGWMTSVEFYFGADYNNVTNSFEDYGYVYSPSLWKSFGFLSTFTDPDNTKFSKFESQYDIAVIGVNKNIGNDLGWLGLDPSYNSGIIPTKAVGYPDGSTGMLSENVNVQKDTFYHIYQSNEVIFGPGASGGPLLVDNYVIGVMSTISSSSNGWADISSVYVDLIGSMSSNDSLIA